MKQHIDTSNDIECKPLVKILAAALIGMTIATSSNATAGEYDGASYNLNLAEVSENQIQIHLNPSTNFTAVIASTDETKSKRDSGSSTDDPYSARIVDC